MIRRLIEKMNVLLDETIALVKAERVAVERKNNSLSFQGQPYCNQHQQQSLQGGLSVYQGRGNVDFAQQNQQASSAQGGLSQVGSGNCGRQ